MLVISVIGSMIFSTFMDQYGITDLFSGRFPMLVFDMSFAIGFGGESKITNGALEGFFSSMGTHMSRKGGLVIGAVRTGTDITDVRRTIHMFFVVTLQCSQIGEHGITQSTREFSFEFHVPDQVIIFIWVDVIAVGNRACSGSSRGGQLFD